MPSQPVYPPVRMIDEDDMSSDSPIRVPTQQSVKAYVDNGLETKLDAADVPTPAGDGVADTYARSDHGHAGGGDDSIAVGNGAEATGSSSMAIGEFANADSLGAFAFGAFTEASASQAFAMGSFANARAQNALAWGANAGAGTGAANAIALGTNASVQAEQAVAIGNSISIPSTSPRSFGVGYNADVPASTPDRGILKANTVEVVRSDGTGGTTLRLRSPDESTADLTVTNGDILQVNSQILVDTNTEQTLSNKLITGPSKTTPVDADEFLIRDSADLGRTKELTLANVVANYLDNHYYAATVIDGLLAAEVAAIDARMEEFNMDSAGIYNAFTHGGGRSGAIGNAALTAENIYFTPIWVKATTTFNAIGTQVTVAGAALTTARLGVFTLDLANLGLATLVLDAGTVDVSSTGNKEAVIDLQLTPGRYWLALHPEVAISVLGASVARGYLYSISANTPLGSRVQTGGPYAAFAAVETTNTASATVYSTYLKVA